MINRARIHRIRTMPGTVVPSVSRSSLQRWSENANWYRPQPTVMTQFDHSSRSGSVPCNTRNNLMNSTHGTGCWICISRCSLRIRAGGDLKLQKPTDMLHSLLRDWQIPPDGVHGHLEISLIRRLSPSAYWCHLTSQSPLRGSKHTSKIATYELYRSWTRAYQKAQKWRFPVPEYSKYTPNQEPHVLIILWGIIEKQVKKHRSRVIGDVVCWDTAEDNANNQVGPLQEYKRYFK
jgi:hypothetical protein